MMKLAGQQHGHARHDVVPDDDGPVHIGRVVVHHDRQGIGVGERARPRPGAYHAHAADDEQDAEKSVKHRADHRRGQSRAWAAVGAFPQG